MSREEGKRMQTNFTFEMRPEGYTHVQIRPYFKITLESTTRLWDELQTFCEANSCWRALCEGTNPTREMSPNDIFESGRAAAEKLLGLQVAFHWEGYQADNLTDIFKSVAHNKGVSFAFFDSRGEALEWLGVGGAERKESD
jgi:hypothetical protein